LILRAGYGLLTALGLISIRFAPWKHLCSLWVPRSAVPPIRQVLLGCLPARCPSGVGAGSGL